MSWSFQAIGSPKKVAEAIEQNAEKISKDPKDQSRQEFEQVKPHLLALVNANFAEDNQYSKPAIKIAASGSASRRLNAETKEWETVSSSCNVSIECLYGFVG